MVAPLFSRNKHRFSMLPLSSQVFFDFSDFAVEKLPSYYDSCPETTLCGEDSRQFPSDSAPAHPYQSATGLCYIPT